MNPKLRFAALLVAFVGLTALGVWWAAPAGEVLERAWHELAGLGLGNALVLVAIGCLVIAAEMIRLVVFGRVLGIRVPFRAAFDASVANDLFSWISPGGVLGEPAAVFVMVRRGVPVDAALVISFGKFATSFALIMGLATVLLLCGYGPAIPAWAVASIAVTIGFGVVLVGGFIAGAWWPGPTIRTIDRFEAWLFRKPRGELATRMIAGSAAVGRRSIRRLAKFRSGGVLGHLAIFSSHVLYYGAYVALLVAIAKQFDARSAAAVMPIAIVYQAFTYLAPTPGIAEAGAGAFFGGVLPDGGAFVVVLLFRSLTAYLQILLGLVYLPVGGMLRSILGRDDPQPPDGPPEGPPPVAPPSKDAP